MSSASEPNAAPPFERQVTCPACNGPSLYSPRNPFRPFCCERCKNIDFGAWSSEQFRVAAEAPPDDVPHGDPKERP